MPNYVHRPPTSQIQDNDVVLELDVSPALRTNPPGDVKRLVLFDDGPSSRTRYTLICPCGVESYSNTRPRRCPGCHRVL
jgi:hypothetical protein